MMELIDTHSHLYAEEFDVDRAEAMQRAVEAGVSSLLLPAIDSASHARLLAMCRDYPDRCHPMMGLHPTSIGTDLAWRQELALVERHLTHPPLGGFCAVGEIGLDFYWSRDFCVEQLEVFRYQIELALCHDLPIVVHVRDAWPQTISLLQEYRGRGLRGVFHAFSDTVESYRLLSDCGEFVFGIGGVVTFKNSTLAEVVRAIPLRRIVLETDCPYLTPAPFRGHRNESAYIPYICDKIAALKGITPIQVAAQTTENARRIFPIKTCSTQ